MRLEAGYWPPWAPNRARKRLIPNIFRQKTPHQRCTSDPTRKIKPLCRGSLDRFSGIPASAVMGCYGQYMSVFVSDVYNFFIHGASYV